MLLVLILFCATPVSLSLNRISISFSLSRLGRVHFIEVCVCLAGVVQSPEHTILKKRNLEHLLNFKSIDDFGRANEYICAIRVCHSRSVLPNHSICCAKLSLSFSQHLFTCLVTTTHSLSLSLFPILFWLKFVATNLYTLSSRSILVYYVVWLWIESTPFHEMLGKFRAHTQRQAVRSICGGI